MVSYQAPPGQAQNPPSATQSLTGQNQDEAADSRVEQADIPAILRPGFGALPQKNTGDRSKAAAQDDMPAALKPGVKMAQSNPFRAGKETPLSTEPPSNAFANMDLSHSSKTDDNANGCTSNNPWGSALLSNPKPADHAPQLLQELDDGNPWTNPAPTVPGKDENVSALAENAIPHSKPTLNLLDDDNNAWDDVATDIKKPGHKKDEDSDDEWNMIDSETSSLADVPSQNITETQPAQPTQPTEVEPVKSHQTGQTLKPVPAPVVETPIIESVAATSKPSDESKEKKTADIQQAPAAKPPAITAPIAQDPLDSVLPPPGPPPTHIISVDKPAKEVRATDESPLIDFTSTEEAQSSQAAAKTTEDRPPLPPRETNFPQWTASRQPTDPQSEIYQVKNIRWHDHDSQTNPRASPILIQNENGPCPLVALVNALSLTTPTDGPDTALVQALRSRERVSLNLVLDVVFDELMSRTPSDDALPDVTELYSFLQSLHTGMNVNPRYIPTPEMVNAYKRSSLTHLHPTDRDNLMPGTFENSMEMKLYATFSIPLIHGWLPEKSSPAYEAFERQAATYEDAQNLLFREEELEDKLSRPGQGLSGSEQQLYQDIMTIKMFMNESATQLTPWGIEVIGRAIRPGTFAILFRNDHFSTLYCHPHTTQLLTLVTDEGYRSHDEVVWESLVDVTGERTEMYSGDFRVVGPTSGAGSSSLNNHASSSSRVDTGEGQWQTVQNKRGKNRQSESQPQTPVDAAEQEDRDLALALQLQEEEEERQREETSRRRRERELSEQFIEQQGRPPAPVNRNSRQTSTGGRVSSGTPAAGRVSSNSGRRNSNSNTTTNIPVTGSEPVTRPQTQQVRPLVPPRRPTTHRPTEGSEDAPPSYEQSAHDRTYVPGANGAGSRPGAATQATNNTNAQGQMHGGGGYYGQQQSQSQYYRPQRPGRVSGGGYGGQGGYQARDRDCVVM